MATQTIDMSNVETCTFNNQNVGEIYLNSDKIWPTSSEYIELFISGGELDLTFDEDFNDNIEISLDGGGQVWEPMYAGDNLFLGSGDRLRVRGFSNQSVGNSNHTPMWSTIVASGNPIIDCYGRLDALLDYRISAMNQVPQMTDNAFDSLFQNWTMLRHAPDISLATSLPQAACYNLFRGCSNLINAPKLPATTLGYNCYANMFRNCVSLVTAPSLPATTLGDLCYDSMFYGCVNLINGPSEIPALSLPGGACKEMFRNCSSLISGPNILATSYTGGLFANNKSFYATFLGCSALTKAPDLLATTIPQGACQTMFADCSSLRVPPKIYATTLADSALNNTFRGCVNLEKLPKLNIMSAPKNSAQRMFSGCSKIKISETQTGEYVNAYRVPFTGTSTADAEACYQMFYNTGGTYTGTATINTTYYTSNEIAD